MSPTPTALARVGATEGVEAPTAPARTAIPAVTRDTTAAPESTPALVPTIEQPEPTATTPERATPDPEDLGLSQEAQEFARRLQDASFALEALPAYSYRVTDSSLAPGLVLTARVASPERREWTVSEQGAPDHMVARWILADGKAYTDVTGRWERIEELPFDTDSPISFGRGYTAALFQPYGRVTDTGRKDALLGSQTATRYDLQMDLGDGPGEGGPFPADVSAKSTHSLWVTREGGYLLRYRSSELYAGSEAATRMVEVTPLGEAPQIRAPRVGSAVFEGNPPPWRAAVIGQQRLRTLESYAFSMRHDEGQYKVVVNGQVSDSQGRVSGTVPDFASVFEDFDPDELPDPEDVKSIEVDVVYREGKIWARLGKGSFRRVSASPTAGTLQDTNALTLLGLLPGGPPEGLLGEQFALIYEESVFGVTGPHDLTLISQGKLVGTERVNGVRALHYRGLSDGTDSPAELWLAADGLHLVRSQSSTPGVADIPPGAPPPPVDVKPGRSRTDIYDANKPFTVQPPETR